MRSEVLDLEFKVIDRNPLGVPILIRFSDGIEYDREEMDMLKSASPETKRQLHKVKSILGGLIYRIDEVM